MSTFKFNFQTLTQECSFYISLQQKKNKETAWQTSQTS